MQILALIEIDDEHQFSECDKLYDRLHGFKTELIPMPKKMDYIPIARQDGKSQTKVIENIYSLGWNACIDELFGGKV